VALKVPNGTPIYANINEKPPPPRPISAEWLFGWCDTMRDSDYPFTGVYGIYARKLARGFLGDIYAVVKTRMPPGFAPSIYSQFPVLPDRPKPSAEIEFKPELPPNGDFADIWQYAVNWPGGFKWDTNLATQRGFKLMTDLNSPIPSRPRAIPNIDPIPKTAGVEPGPDPGDIAAAAAAVLLQGPFGAFGTDPNEQVDEDVAAE
jgi:hypothetical protein